MAKKSTIVRLIQVVATLLKSTAPNVAARLLERLFLTPLRWRTPRREIGWMAKAERSSLPFDESRKLPVLTWGRGPTVLLVHGWSGRGSQMGAFVAPLVEGGFRVVTFDAPGHGEADGRLSGLPEIAAAVERVAKEVGPVQAIIAHSLGTAATTIALSRGLSAERLVYVAPPENPGLYLFRAARFLGFGDEVARRTQSRIERRFGFLFDDARGTTLAESLDVPLLVIHDEGDADVPHAEGSLLAEGWAGASLMTTHGLGHRRILRDLAVVDAAVAFVSTPRESARPDASYQEDLALPDGRVLSLRPLQPTDKETLSQALARMSPESRHYRFMGGRNDLSEETLRYLCEVDGFDHFAIGVAARSADGRDEGVAVARFVRLKDQPSVAEPAITVLDDYQGQGLGRILLDRLASAARERGIEKFHCELLTSNKKARRLLTGFDAHATARQDGDVVTMELDLHRSERLGELPHALEEVA